MASTKEISLKAVHEAWNELKDVLARVPPDRMEDAGVVGPWSVKDIIGHITTWERVLMDSIEAYRVGEDPEVLKYSDYADINEFNERSVQEKTGTTLSVLTDDLKSTHEDMMVLLNSLPEAAFHVSDIEGRVREDSFRHYREHTASILHWLEETPTSGQQHSS